MAGSQPHVYALVVGIALLLGTYLKYLALAYFFDDTRPPVRSLHWLVLATLILTEGLSYTLFPSNRFLAKDDGTTEVRKARSVGKAVAYGSAVAAGLPWGLLIFGGFLLLTQGVAGSEQPVAQWATRIAPIPIVAAGMVSLISLPLFLTRALREEDDLAWLWFVTLLVSPIVGSMLWVRSHPWRSGQGGIATAAPTSG
jgi:hypothetical protein